MKAAAPRRKITLTITRRGDAEPEDRELESMTPGERMLLVCELSLAALCWNRDPNDLPRLQRSVARIQRKKRRVPRSGNVPGKTRSK